MLYVFLIATAVIALMPALIFACYRHLLPVLGKFTPEYQRQHSVSTAREHVPPSQSVALLCVSHAYNQMLIDKLSQQIRLRDMSDVSYPVTRICVGLDGHALPEQLPTELSDETITWISNRHAQGKNRVLAELIKQADADILVFSDLDARIPAESLSKLLAPFANTEVGAVTGKRAIVDDSDFAVGQSAYVDADDRIRGTEMTFLGSVTSADGKLYAVRRSLLDTLPADVTDDLYNALSAIASGRRLLFEPAAVAYISRPARNIRHEITRRRRVTTRGLSTLFRRRQLLNPFRTGSYAWALLINKGFRRLAGPGLLLAFVALSILMLSAAWQAGFAMFALVILLAVLCGIAIHRAPSISYALLGLLGMSLGVVDYLLGKRVSRWQPRKSESAVGQPNPSGVKRERI